MITCLTIDPSFITDFKKIDLFESFTGLCHSLKCTSTACFGMEFAPATVTHTGPEPGRLYIETVSQEALFECLKIGDEHPGLTLGEYTVLCLARRDELTLITNDTRVREVALKLHINVYNYLWVIAEMVKAGSIGFNEAGYKYHALEKMSNIKASPEKSKADLYNALNLRKSA